MTTDSTHEARIVPGEAEALAQRFHETYERLAPSFGYETREESAKPWADVPDQNKRLMIAVCGEILAATPSAPPEAAALITRLRGGEVERLREALEWIGAFADVRSKDDSKTFARVNRGALRTISERARTAIQGESRD